MRKLHTTRTEYGVSVWGCPTCGSIEMDNKRLSAIAGLRSLILPQHTYNSPLWYFDTDSALGKVHKSKTPEPSTLNLEP